LLPLGLAHNVKLKRDVALGEALKWAEAACDSFERLGMPPDMRAMRELILTLKAS